MYLSKKIFTKVTKLELKIYAVGKQALVLLGTLH
jgi:hypothetical protein